MNVSHVLYKANHLEEAVQEFRDRGFTVEYGSRKNPHNALIYFSEGPYIEILSKAPVSSVLLLLLRLIGQSKVADRFAHWKSVEEGFFGLCLETDKTDFVEEEEILKHHSQRFFKTKSSRTDPSNRPLRWALLFPHELQLPFMMTYFNIDPKPVAYVHPNGVRGIETITFGTDTRYFPIMADLCEDPVLQITDGRGVVEVLYHS